VSDALREEEEEEDDDNLAFGKFLEGCAKTLTLY
jgi:hypothetical protein